MTTLRWNQATRLLEQRFSRLQAPLAFRKAKWSRPLASIGLLRDDLSRFGLAITESPSTSTEHRSSCTPARTPARTNERWDEPSER